MRGARIVAGTIALAITALPLRPASAAPRCYPTDRFVVLADGMVEDVLTSLVWQQDGGEKEQATWAEAQTYCSELTLGGYSDWRLPTVKELRSIVDYTAVGGRAINRTAFSNTWDGEYWTSTPYAGVSGTAWFVAFMTGYSNGSSVLQRYMVRCVR